jgi:protein-tyrosine phosphatase
MNYEPLEPLGSNEPFGSTFHEPLEPSGSTFHEIVKNLYLGNASAHHNLSVDLIVNCCPEINVNYGDNNNNNKNKNIIWLKFYDDKDDNEKLVSLLYTTQVLEKIHSHLTSGKSVLVHCAMGIQRSASVVACYLLKYVMPQQNTSAVIKYIQSKREEAFSTGYVFLPTMAFYSLLHL